MYDQYWYRVIMEPTVQRGRAMFQAISRWPFAANARVRSQTSPCGLLVDRVVVTSRPSSTSVFLFGR